MDFKKKLKTRLYLAIAYIIIGLATIIAAFITKTSNEFFSSFGFALIVIGIVRVRSYFIITKSEDNLKKQQIRESDERNVSISTKAKSFSFTLYIILSGIVVIVLQCLKETQHATIIGGTVCALILIYWISYFVINKKS